MNIVNEVVLAINFSKLKSKILQKILSQLRVGFRQRILEQRIRISNC
jgi:hypothetical protein